MNAVKPTHKVVSVKVDDFCYINRKNFVAGPDIELLDKKTADAIAKLDAEGYEVIAVTPITGTGAENAMTIGMQITGRLWGGNRYWLRLFDFVGRLMPK
ncbi:MAG: hypothetical protein LWW81_15620 [Rhodocyclales bacterium]|nr:hypothetical protein [Rhodocyclales bacterium]